MSLTQELMAFILRRQSSPIYGVLERTKPEKRTKYIKTALQIAKNETPKDRKAKEQALAEKANK